MGSEERSERHRLCDADDVEVLLSLLAEEVGEECYNVRDRYDRSSRRVQVEKRGNDGGICYKGKKKNVGSGVLESNSKNEYTFKSRVEDKRRKEDRGKEERENFLRGENCRARKEGSSCSSYYSFSSSGEFESDIEVQAKSEGFVGEPPSGYKRDAKRNGGITYDGEVMEEVERHGDYAEEHGVVLKKENTAKRLNAASSGIECDWRKKSEKKLTEVSIEQTRKESSQKHSRLSDVHESGYGKASTFHKPHDDREKKSTLDVNVDEGKKHYNQIGGQVTGQSESRMKYKEFTKMSEIHGSDVETTSSSQKQYSGKEENVTAAVSLVQETRGEHRKTAGRISRQDKCKRNSQQLAEVSEIQEINLRGTSTSLRQSETRMKNCEDNPTMIMSSTDDTEEQHHQAGQWVTRQTDLRGKSQQLTDISDTLDVDTEGTFISQRQSDTRMKKHDESSKLAFSSDPEAREQRSQIDPKAYRRLESRTGSQDITNISRVHNSDNQTVTKTQRVPEKRMSSQERHSTSVVKAVEETKEGDDLTDERVLQIGSRKEAQRPTKVLSFQERMPEEASSSQASLKLNFQSKVQQIGVDEGDKRSSLAIVMPPSSQLETRAPLHVESTSEFATEEVSSESLESGSSALLGRRQQSSPALQHELYSGARRGETHGDPLNLISHEDALGSADRLQKSSMHFVGEFVEKVRHEVSTAEIHKEKKTYETKLVYEDDQRREKGLSHYGSGDSQPKEHDLRHSSRGSGTKGPSDEMWDVTGPSTQAPPETEVLEGTTTTGNAVVKRTGRSLWNIMTDIFRMRWASRSETHNSASKSGERGSPNQSTSSEAWFSGHEPDENNDEYVKKEGRSMPQEPTSVAQQQVGRIPTKSQGEGSSLISSKDKIKHVGEDSLSSSSILESGSASKSISSHSGEENFGKNFEGTSSGTAIAESSVPLPAIRLRRSPVVEEVSEAGKTDTSGSGTVVQIGAESSFPLPAIRIRRSPVVEEISEAGKTDAPGSGTVVQIEQPVTTVLTEVSRTEGKDGELKQRKLQRKDQVLKDGFDEWEEAYNLETEQRKIDEMFMREALLEAKKAADIWEVPVGAVLVQHGKIIARGRNLVEELRDSTAHAEMICIREASNTLRTWRLSDTKLYVTLEPCPMCAGAILQARVDTVVWGAPNKLLGADGSWIRLFPNGGEGGNGLEPRDQPTAPVHPFHPKITIRRGVLASECADVMQQFFQLRRKKKEKKPDPPTPPSCLPISSRPSKFLTKMHDAFSLMFCL